ncbi:carbohydrate esterase [Plenodomus biglobosus]|nr:carbohydrate esterase [Plenodomus biglobosus]
MKIPASAALFAGLAAARPNCPKVHIIGARETTAPQSNPYGTATPLVNQTLASYPGSTAEAIVYPACSGQEACGGIQFPDSLAQGTAAVIRAVNTYNAQCPSTKIILIGYSQV